MKAWRKGRFWGVNFVFRYRGRRKIRRGITRSQPPREATTSNATPLAMFSAMAAQSRTTAHCRAFPTARQGLYRVTKPAQFPHKFRPGIIAAHFPHNTHTAAQVFLPIIAQRCNKTLEIRGKMSYQYKHLTAQKCKERQL